MSALAQGPFATTALQLRSYGLAPIPCAASDDGKVPGIRTKNWNERPGAAALRQLVLRFPHENIGILTGLSRVSVVDIDDAHLADAMIRRFGSTPLAVETPSGGIHLYYRASGERCANLRKPEGLPVDIKGDGGFVVVPPSVRPSGPHAGKLYRFAEGSWEDVARLPAMKHDSLPTRPTAQPGGRGRDPRPAPIPDGTRHTELSKIALREVKGCDAFDDLLDKMRYVNVDRCVPPLDDAEVIKQCRSAWQMETEGRNFAGSERRVWTRISDHEALKRSKCGGDASILLNELQFSHFGARSFALSPLAMSRAGVIVGWTIHRYRDARACLLDIGAIVRVHKGGRGKHDPALFCFREDAATLLTN